MILVKEMPTSGQFVAVWAIENGIQSDSYMWENGNLMYLSYHGWEIGVLDDHLKDAVFILQSPKT